MMQFDWLNGFRAAVDFASQQRVDRDKRRSANNRRCSFETLEDRCLLAADFGDAPDIALGTGVGNYQTLLTDNGPSHTIVAGLRLGAQIDADDGTLQNTAANADDVDSAQPIDEDGLANPAADLVLTVGTQPTVNVWVTNTTGTTATLYGWIDYNADGVFDNATERASVAVPDGTNSGITTLVFPAVPSGFTGTTYARFRLSTDAAAANSFGPANDGEVEDYRATIMDAGGATFDTSKSQVIGDSLGGGPPLVQDDYFGSAVASLGDLDGDCISDMVVGAPGNDTGGTGRGAVYVLFMNHDGSVRSYQTIASGTPNGPTLANYNAFGISVAALGDLDGDGVSEIAVGAQNDGANLAGRGAVYVLFMNPDGTVKSSQKIGSNLGGGPTLETGAFFGSSIASLGDFDGDGVWDIVVGADGEWNGGSQRGAVYVLLLNTNGTVKSYQKISHGVGGGPTLVNNTYFGYAVASLGDLDDDGVVDIVVGTDTNSEAGFRGFVYVLRMNPDGTVKASQQIADGVGGGPVLGEQDHFGLAVTALGDFDADGVPDMAVAAPGDYSDERQYGAVHILLMNSDGTVKESRKLKPGAPEESLATSFGASLAMLGDLDGDGLRDLAVVSQRNGTIVGNRDAIRVLFGQRTNHFTPQFISPTTLNVSENNASAATIAASDADVPSQVLKYTIVGGTDAGWFTLTSDGQLAFKRPPDFEAPIDADRDNTYIVTIEVSDGHAATATETFQILVTNVDDAPSVDYGDAPDTNSGNGLGNYSTTAADNGPRHTIVPGLWMGAYIDGESGSLQDTAASADDWNGMLPDDEDGVLSPLTSLAVTIDAAPSVHVRVTNTTGAAATLNGWIDYNADGVFDNATERASVAVPDGSSNALAMLTFPAVPGGYIGMTYARFRLSTDVAAADPFGAAADGEVEDYRAAITAPGIGQTDPTKTQIIVGHGADSVVALGDLDGDGVSDLAVGDTEDANGGAFDRGAVNVLLMNADGTVKTSKKITYNTGGGPALEYFDNFGSALAALGDLDGDGVPDMAVGARYSDDGIGSVYVLFMNSDGTANHYQKISSGVGGGPVFDEWTSFGGALACLGDMDGDGVTELAVGASSGGYDSSHTGAVYVLFLNADGTVKQSQMIASELGGGPVLERRDSFGASLASLGDVDGDGVGDIAVGAYNDYYDESVGEYRGVVHILLMNADGTVKQATKIGNGVGGAPPLSDDDLFGFAIASLGDLDGDGIPDIGVGAPGYAGGDSYDVGAVYVLLLNADGTAKTQWRIGDDSNGGPPLESYNHFGNAIASLGDLDGDGIVDLAVQARGYDPDVAPALYVLFLQPFSPDYGDAPDTGAGTGPGNYQTRADDNGPSHVIMPGLHLGARVDSDSGQLAGATATADNANGVLPGDEDGLVNAVADLRLTTGTVPTVSLWVTNTTGAAAMLYGWIDYNADGVFDNATERASVAVPDGTDTANVTLTFPVVPSSSSGTTYARFRLSTDPAAANSTGPAADGEVEDYRLQITAPSSGLADATKTKKLARNMNGVPNQDIYLGKDLASVGDLDGDGVTDLVTGSGYTLFMNPNGTVKRTQEIGSDVWGDHVAALGDLDGDGVTDIAFGTWDGVYVVHLNADGTAKRTQLIYPYDVMSLAGLGDIDGDGIGDLAAGVEAAEGYGDEYSGAVFVLLLNADGSVKDGQVIGDEIGGGPQLAEDDAFGSAVTSLGDIDGDGISDLAVAAIGDKTGSSDDYSPVGAVYVLLMNDDGTAKSTHKIADHVGGGPTLDDYTGFGCSIASLGDLDGDGVTDIAVGALYDNTGGDGRGALHVLFLNADGTVKRTQKIAHNTGGGPSLANWDNFGSSVTSLGDLDGDGITDIAVGADGDDTAGSNSGAIYVMFSKPAATLPGDYNRDGTVDAADYVVWRKTFGATGVPAFSGADGDGDTTIDQDDYGVWRVHIGQSLPPPDAGSGVSSATGSATLVAPLSESTGQETPLNLYVGEPQQTAEPQRTSGAEQVASQPKIPLLVLAPVTSPVAADRPAARRSLGAQPTFAVSRRDDALVAWLASQPDTEKKVDDFDAAETWKSEDASGADDVYMDSVEHVFALLTSN